MPAFPIVDAHVHLWDLQRLEYPWLDGFPEIKRTFLLSDFDQARGGADVEKIVFLECNPRPDLNLKELEWVTSLARQDRRIQAIVPLAQLQHGEAIRGQLEQMARNPLVRGVRRLIQGEADPEFCLRPAFVRGVQALGDLGLHFEITIAPGHLPQVVRLVERCPDVRFVLDHIANPDIEHGALEPWRSDLQALAACNRVWCKISNLTNNAGPRTWSRPQLVPYFDAVVEAFGHERIIWAGDWPHALRSIRYGQWLELAQWLARGFDERQQRLFFHDNAVAFYRL